ncbi:MAG: Fic family protein [Bacteroidia bacterium]|nr:Fic family protein [Bacteroidia bacterium]
MKPPYTITEEILNLVGSISEKLGEVKSARLTKPPAELRKRNRIKTIQASLNIEGNTLSVEQVTDLINNRRILAPEKDILEVKNAINVYEMLHDFDLYSLQSLLNAHKKLMSGLVKNAGQLRDTSVGIVKGDNISHIAPPSERLQELMTNLFNYLKNDSASLLIKSCVFHYEFEFIHPFLDGNGRIGRLWQTLILKEHSPVFEFLPIETLIKEHQKEYYRALEVSDKVGNSTSFIEFMLAIIDRSLENLLQTQNIHSNKTDRIDIFRDIIGDNYFTRADYLRHNKEISSATASRDLRDATQKGILEKIGNNRTTTYRFAR